jgi:hypothetical protein
MELLTLGPACRRQLSVERDFTLDQIAAELGALSRDQRVVLASLLDDFAVHAVLIQCAGCMQMCWRLS